MMVSIALRNLLGRPARSLALGGIIAFSACVAVLGLSAADALKASLKRSLTRSVVGDLQIYSSDAKDALAIFRPAFSGRQKLGKIPEIEKIRAAILEKIPAVQELLPQGFDYAMVNPGNLLDMKLNDLREATSAKKPQAALVRDLKAQIHGIVAATAENYKRNLKPSGALPAVELKRAEAALKRALAPAFWADFGGLSAPAAEFLSESIAPLIFENTRLYLGYIGTDPARMAAAFPLLEVVRGRMIPEGEPGFMINDYVYEHEVKARLARNLDAMNEAMAKGRTLARDAGLQGLRDRNIELAPGLESQLSPAAASALKAALGGPLPDFFRMDDANFKGRYALFYREIAPRIMLYHLRVGDSFTLRSLSESGDPTAVNVKIWGTFRFKNFEHSPLAGNFNLLDLQSFRKLYGFTTPEQLRQSRELKAEMAASGADLNMNSKDEDAIFGGRPVATAPRGPNFRAPRREAEAAAALPGDGPCLNAAVVLKPGADAAQAAAAITALSKAEGLGIQVADWQQGAGLLGQLSSVFMGLLYGLIALVFVVGAIILQNALALAARQRSSEIGTLRAIGAQRSFVLRMVFAESLLLSAFFAVLGAGIGLGLLAWLGAAGIPVPAEQLTFIFSGSRLMLAARPLWALEAAAVTMAISQAAALYPALQATRISPVQAMQRP